jgi:hypothetical protein
MSSTTNRLKRAPPQLPSPATFGGAATARLRVRARLKRAPTRALFAPVCSGVARGGFQRIETNFFLVCQRQASSELLLDRFAVEIPPWPPRLLRPPPLPHAWFTEGLEIAPVASTGSGLSARFGRKKKAHSREEGGVPGAGTPPRTPLPFAVRRFVAPPAIQTIKFSASWEITAQEPGLPRRDRFLALGSLARRRYARAINSQS